MATVGTRNRTVGQFGVEATSISQVDIGAASYSRPGIVDKSKAVEYQGYANLAQNVGNIAATALKQGNEFYEGMQLADLEKEHEANIQQYIDSKNNPQIAQDAAVDASALEMTSNSLWNKLGEGASIEDVDNIEKQYQSKLATMKSAVKQGVISQDEFAERALAITRKAVNRNPALYDDIIRHSKKVMNLTGMDDLLAAEKKQGEAASKAYEKQVEYHMQIAKAENIPVKYDRYGNVDFHDLKQKTDQVQQEKFAAETIKRTDNLRTQQEKDQARDFISNFGIDGANGIINNTNEIINKLLTNPDIKGEQTAKIRQIITTSKQAMAAKVGPLLHHPEVKEVFDYFNKTADANLSMYESMTRRDDQVKHSENLANIIRSKDYQRIAAIASPAAVEMSVKALQVAGPRLAAENPAAYSKLMQTYGNIFSAVTNGLDTDYSVKDDKGRSGVAGAVEAVARFSAEGDANAKIALDTATSTIYEDSKVKFKSTEEKYKFYDDYIKAMAEPSTTEGWKRLDEGARTKAAANFDEYMAITLKGFKEDLGAVANKGADIKLSQLPDGRLVIQTSNPTDTEMLNQKYGIRVNNGVKAFANLIGSGTKQAADTMFQQYDVLKDISPVKAPQEKEGSPNASNPLNLTIPGKTGKFQKFESTEEGIRAASAQLDRYYTGKTPGTGSGLNTLNQIGGKWNNEKEPGSTSKKDYVATLVQYMGVGANTPLNLNDLNVKADLIYAMSVAEGRPLRPSLIMSALGK